MTDVFLSYSRADQNRITQLVEVLEQHGYSVWRDIDIPPTGSFDDYIRERLNDCKCVVVLWSRTSARSNYVRGEARAAFKAGKLISVAIDPWPEFEQDVPLDFHGFEHADLSQWNGEADNHEIGLVLKAIENLTAKPPLTLPGGDKPWKPRLRPVGWAIVATISVTVAASAIYLYIQPVADCSVEVTVERLNAVPVGVNIAYLEIVGRSRRQRVPVSPAGKSVLEITDDIAASWQLNIQWDDDVHSQVGDYHGCPESAQDRSPDGRAEIRLRAR